MWVNCRRMTVWQLDQILFVCLLVSFWIATVNLFNLWYSRLLWHARHKHPNPFAMYVTYVHGVRTHGMRIKRKLNIRIRYTELLLLFFVRAFCCERAWICNYILQFSFVVFCFLFLFFVVVASCQSEVGETRKNNVTVKCDRIGSTDRLMQVDMDTHEFCALHITYRFFFLPAVRLDVDVHAGATNVITHIQLATNWK